MYSANASVKTSRSKKTNAPASTSKSSKVSGVDKKKKTASTDFVHASDSPAFQQPGPSGLNKRKKGSSSSSLSYEVTDTSKCQSGDCVCLNDVETDEDFDNAADAYTAARADLNATTDASYVCDDDDTNDFAKKGKKMKDEKFATPIVDLNITIHDDLVDDGSLNSDHYIKIDVPAWVKVAFPSIESAPLRQLDRANTILQEERERLAIQKKLNEEQIARLIRDNANLDKLMDRNEQLFLSNKQEIDTLRRQQQLKEDENQTYMNQLIQSTLSKIVNFVTIRCPVCIDICHNNCQFDCGHFLCKNCLNTFFDSRRSTCPLCRADINTISYIDEKLTCQRVHYRTALEKYYQQKSISVNVQEPPPQQQQQQQQQQPQHEQQEQQHNQEQQPPPQQ